MEDGIQIMIVKIGEKDYGLDTGAIRRVLKRQTLSHPVEKNVSYITGGYKSGWYPDSGN